MHGDIKKDGIEEKEGGCGSEEEEDVQVDG